MAERPILICTRGSALALAQSNMIAAQCRAAFPGLQFELKIIKTTGDKLQRASMAKSGDQAETLPKGLFTKELEVALLKGQADIAVHSLKDLPTDLPAGLILAATPQREDVRDVLVYRDAAFSQAQGSEEAERRGFPAHIRLKDLPRGATVATSSTRRKMSLLAGRPDLHVVDIRGNVATRMQKVADQGELDATILALAGLKRLNFQVWPDGSLHGDAVPEGMLATVLELDEILPCVGQAAIGIEIRADDARMAQVCERLNHPNTFHAVTAERAFLRGMGGGCQSPVGAYAQIVGAKISLEAISFRDESAKRASAKRPVAEAALLGEQIAEELK